MHNRLLTPCKQPRFSPATCAVSPSLQPAALPALHGPPLCKRVWSRDRRLGPLRQATRLIVQLAGQPSRISACTPGCTAGYNTSPNGPLDWRNRAIFKYLISAARCGTARGWGGGWSRESGRTHAATFKTSEVRFSAER